MTPDSVISSHKSLPSRVRSPTPAKTENPPCCLATLLMSSMITTVLPTPAPPNKPILPPLRKGWIRSTTFTPVSNISALVTCSSKLGAHREGFAGDPQRLVDWMHGRFGELHVHRGSGDLNDFADVFFCHWLLYSRLLLCRSEMKIAIARSLV